MSSELMESMGLADFDIAYIFIALIALILILFIMIIVQISKTSKLKKRYEKFMLGKEAGSLEKEIVQLFEDIDYLKTGTDKNLKEIKNLYKKLEGTYQKLGIVKYDAFKQMGGQLSFCIAMLNEKDDGFIMNSVHSTDGCYSYTKEIKRGECSISLGGEEVEALNKAMGIVE